MQQKKVYQDIFFIKMSNFEKVMSTFEKNKSINEKIMSTFLDWYTVG